MSKNFDPSNLTISQVQQVFRFLGIQPRFVLVPNEDTQAWQRLQALTDLQAEYIAFLTEADQPALQLAAAHGYQWPQEIVDKGASYRQRIKALQDAAEL